MKTAVQYDIFYREGQQVFLGSDPLLEVHMKIIHCEIGPMPRPIPKGLMDKMPEVIVTYNDGTQETLFSYYPDEISFAENEFIGLTRDQAIALRHEKDVAYLRS